MSDLLEKVSTKQSQQVVRAGKGTIFDLMTQSEKAFQRALPDHVKMERFVRVATTTLRTNPALMNCKPQSLLAALMVSAQLGLEPGGPLGHAYLVPYGTECTFIAGYRGLIDLARRSGHIASIYAEAVFENDEFDWELGLHRDIKHKPTDPQRDDPRRITHVYAVAKFKDDTEQFVVLTRDQITATQQRSQSGKKNQGPWATDWAAMALKTAVRRLMTWLPLSVEQAEALNLDEKVVTTKASDVLNVASIIEIDDSEELEPEQPEQIPVNVDVETGEVIA